MSDVTEAAARFFRGSSRLRRFVKRHAIFNRLLANLLPRYRLCAVRPDSDVVVEGFPRCANTFAVVALKMSQPTPLKVGRHLHSLGHVYRGLQLGKPTLIVIRNPRDSVLSFAIAQPKYGLDALFREYVDFYRGIEQLGDDVVLGEFDEITSDFGAVVRRLNSRFETTFNEFDPTPENVERCYELIEQEERRNTGNVIRPEVVSRPTEARAEKKRKLAASLEVSPTRELLTDAEQVYARLLSRHKLRPTALNREGAAAPPAAK